MGKQNSYGAARGLCRPREWTYDCCSKQPRNSPYGPRSVMWLRHQPYLRYLRLMPKTSYIVHTGITLILIQLHVLELHNQEWCLELNIHAIKYISIIIYSSYIEGLDMETSSSAVNELICCHRNTGTFLRVAWYWYGPIQRPYSSIKFHQCHMKYIFLDIVYNHRH